MAEWLKKIIVLSLLLWGSGMAAWGQQVSGVDSAPIVNASSISADDTTVFGNERGMVQKMMKKNKADRMIKDNKVADREVEKMKNRNLK